MWKRTTPTPPPPTVSLSLRQLFFFFWFAAISCLALPQRWSERPFLTTIKSTRLLRPPWALLLFPSSPPQTKKGRRLSSANGGCITAPWGCLAKLWLVPHGSPNLPATDAKRSDAVPWLPFGMEGDWRGSLNNGKHFSKPPWRIPSSFFHTCFFSLSQFSICYPTHHPLERPKFFYPYEQIENPISVVFLQSFTLQKKEEENGPRSRTRLLSFVRVGLEGRRVELNCGYVVVG